MGRRPAARRRGTGAVRAARRAVASSHAGQDDGGRGIGDELRGFGELVGSLVEEDLQRITRCEDWTVGDVAGHVIGTVADLAAGRLEGQGSPEVTARQARERRGHTPDALVEELAAALPAVEGLLATLPEEAWTGPSFTDPRYPLGFAVEALWYDAYVHGEDVRAALSLPPGRGAGLRCAVHHTAGYLEHRGWGPATLALEGMERLDISGGGREITGDPLDFVLAATGRRDPATLGLDASINVYA